MCWHHKDLLAFQSEAIKTLSPQRGRQTRGGKVVLGGAGLWGSDLLCPREAGPRALWAGGFWWPHGCCAGWLGPRSWAPGPPPHPPPDRPCAWGVCCQLGGSHGEPEGTQDPHVPWQRLGWGDSGLQARGSASTPPATVTCRWDRPSEARTRPWLGHSSQRLHQGSVWVATRGGDPSPALGSPVVP